MHHDAIVITLAAFGLFRLWLGCQLPQGLLGILGSMELLNYLGIGFSVAFRPENLFYCFVGVFIGTLIGVFPGIGPVGAMSLLLPSTFKTTPEAAIIMLAGIMEPCMMDPQPPFYSISPEKRHLWSLALTATQWPGRAVQDLLWGLLLLALLLPEPFLSLD